MRVLETSRHTETLSKRRRLGGRTADGQYVEGPPVETTIRGVVVPLGMERIIEQDGLRGETGFRVFTREHLEAIAPDSRGDELFIRGRWHRVVKVEHHTSGSGRQDHYEAETISPS